MADPYAETRALLEERPDIEPALESILAVDESAPWSFDDIDVDSGTFGELVSRGIVEKAPSDETNQTYRVSEPEAVKAALTGEAYDATPSSAADTRIIQLRERITQFKTRRNPDLIAGLAVSFVLLFVARITGISRVFRDERVLLPGNDPYYYLYWVERLVDSSPNPLDFEAILEVLGGGFGEPLVPTIGWWATLLFGGNGTNAIEIVAWIPVIASLAVGGGVYLLAVWTTNDERIGILSVVVFAFLPGHVLYSGIGFFDHHALDYVWLTLSIAGVLWLARDHERQHPNGQLDHLTSLKTWLVVAALGVVFAIMVHSWNGSPILLVGLAVYSTLRATSDLRAGWNPLVAATPVVGSLGIGFLLAYALHARAGWQEPVVVYTLALVAVGIVVVAGTATVFRRFDIHPGIHLVTSAVSIVPLWVGFETIRPAAAARLLDRTSGALLGREGIAETRSLFAADFGVIIGPVDHFGWFLFVALPVLGVITWQCVRTHEPRWLVLISYGITLIGFGVLQVRFAGEATSVVAVFSGVGIAHLLSVIELADRPVLFGNREDRKRLDLSLPGGSWQQAGYVVVVIVLLSSLSIFMIPAVTDTLAATDAEADAIDWIDTDASEREGPDYVLSEWGQNRMFNYAVNGDSRSYGYAQSNYESFAQSPNPDSYADQFSDRVGYVVLHELSVDLPPESAYVRLYEEHGSATAATDGSGRFQLSYVTTDGGPAVFRPVNGATITGNATPDSTVTVRTETEVDGLEDPFTYERRTTTDANGTFSIPVAHSGDYEIEGEGLPSDTDSISVSAAMVQNGTRVATA